MDVQALHYGCTSNRDALNLTPKPKFNTVMWLYVYFFRKK